MMLICIGALSSLTFVAIGYKMFVSPYLKRRKYIRNEEFANYIFEKEHLEAQQKLDSSGWQYWEIADKDSNILVLDIISIYCVKVHWINEEIDN